MDLVPCAPIHWEFKASIGSGVGKPPPSSSDGNYLMVGEAKKLHEEILLNHKNSVALKKETESNIFYNKLTRGVRLSVALVGILLASYNKIYLFRQKDWRTAERDKRIQLASDATSREHG